MPYLRVIWSNPSPPKVTGRKPALTLIPPTSPQPKLRDFTPQEWDELARLGVLSPHLRLTHETEE